ncbi:MAG: triose-phosphate isomerase [Desulfovermiculus sp.]|nr:triose-phosphate isomerase [Desulfovermiculus sp.]
MTKLCMAANWKMHKTQAQAKETAASLVRILGSSLPQDREVLLIPPFTALQAVAEEVHSVPGYSLGGQNFYPAEQGAFTGEISPGMLLDHGCSFALAGHSERRHVLGEGNEFVGQKVRFGLDNGLGMILCIGETLAQREDGQLQDVLVEQLKASVSGLQGPHLADKLLIAYEPVWAIGTGKVAQSEDIAQAHAFVRQQLIALLPQVGHFVRILYGGSVKPDNIGQIIGIDNVNGVLVGGAGLEAESMAEIVTGG